MAQRRFEPQYNIIADHKTNPHHKDYDPTFLPQIPEPEYKHYPQPVYYKPGSSLFNEAPSNTNYGYADPRDIPPAESPEPLFKQYPQPFYPPSDGPPRDPAYKSTHPHAGQTALQSEPYAQKKFDYHTDDRFYKTVHQQEQFDRSPRRDHFQEFDRSPRHHRYGHDKPPKYAHDHHDHHDHQQQYDSYHQSRPGYDVVPPAGRANSYSTRITDLLTSVREPQHKDESMAKIMETNKGYLVMMRFNDRDLSDVITAVQENLGTLRAQGGYVIGFSEPRAIRVLIANNEMEARKLREWSSSGACCFWFKDISHAKFWFESTKPFKQPDFPNSHSYDVMVVPLTYGRNEEPLPFTPAGKPVTLLWSEFPHIYEREPYDFLTNYSEPARKIMKHFHGFPHVSLCKFKAGWPDLPNKFSQPGYGHNAQVLERYARAIKNSWVPHDSYITVSTFEHQHDSYQNPDYYSGMERLMAFFYNPDYQRYRGILDNYTNPVFIALTLTPVSGTRPTY